MLGLTAGTGWYVLHAKNTSLSKPSASPVLATHKSTATHAVSETVPLDTDFKTYTNASAGFTLQVPKEVLSGLGSPCGTSDYVYDNYGKKVPSEVSYRPAQGVVPGTVVGDGTNFWVTEEYTYQLTDSHDDGKGHGIFKGCQKTITTPENAAQSERGGTFQLDSVPIKVFTVMNTSQITEKARLIYGNLITGVEGMKLSPSGDYLDVSLKCSDSCMDVLNGRSYLRYYEKQQKLVYMDLGQSGHLQYPKGDGYYGQKVVDSFKLIK